MTGRKSAVPGVILLTGSTGQVGGELLRHLSGSATIVAPTREQMDISRPDEVRAMIRTVKPRWIVNPGAYTAVDKAESEPALAAAVNVASVEVIGEEAVKLGACVIHFSTDYVFAGLGTRPYRETDDAVPLSVYGKTKLAGEQALAASGAAHLIFRTSWVYGASGKNFLLTILKLARERPTLRIVSDQHGAPTWSRDLAGATAAIMDQCEQASSERSLVDMVSSRNGTYHVAAHGETTWYGFACQAIRQSQEREAGTNFARVEAIATKDYPTPAPRPVNSRLDCSKLETTFGLRMPDWQASLPLVLDELSSRRSPESKEIGFEYGQ